MKFNKKVLPSGIRLIAVPLADSNTVTVLILTEIGSKYEKENESGISHFLEHMCFKGTLKRPKAMDITRELDGLGAQYNAFTSHEYTGYYAKSQAQELPKIFDVVSDIYLNSTIPAEEVERERKVIIEEINMYEDLPQRNVHDVFMELLYGNQPAGRSIVGSIKTVSAITPEALKEYSRRYVGENTVVVVSGKFEESQVDELMIKHFSSVLAVPCAKKEAVVEKQDGAKISLKYRKTDQAHIVVGVRTFDIYDKRNITLNVLTSILGGGMSSRLFQVMREERGLGYYVRAGKDGYTDHGYVAVSAGVAIDRVHEAIEVIMSEFRKIKDTLVTSEELERVKKYIVGNMYLELEGSDELASFYGEKEVLRKPLITPAEIEEQVKSVTAEDIKKLAEEIFITKNLNMAMISSHEKSDEFKKLLSI